MSVSPSPSRIKSVRDETVVMALLSALVGLGIIGMEEFGEALLGIGELGGVGLDELSELVRESQFMSELIKWKSR